MNIGFAGLGIMGSAMAANLVKAGFMVTVWNRSTDRCAPLADMGAAVAASPRALAEQYLQLLPEAGGVHGWVIAWGIIVSVVVMILFVLFFATIIASISKFSGIVI